MDGRIDVNITFDENNQIRVLSQEKYRETEQMKTETIDFLKKIMSFNDMVTTLIEVLDSQAQKIEDAKLKAVGARNKIEGEEDNRRAKEQELKTLINEKRLLLERLTFEHDSLQKVDNEQKLTIEKLSNNES
uniref:Uncharacterized protein n=1 Tax=Favella ehrenbergii TaxID=182087 RepID=A0A7S3I744_9SPIT|mmetsp:Transcript_37808/g.49694  ORF Transcript_37808/g.49694 Transcript_37808/m.49694 type:complete len:132 (+) Transcript_37808:33-428(+)|eukprot:CAMPEP_0170464804 /NCGR_PEP_ID=MMETSP0123-20130129/9381_1 /TAXON_ID=182087 /ORGANISM="Favella ehrenbergii, Strain Fehren 1" /LENGTH=131 /DNA_ID=CAMNT_0010730533 /DNA_START=38 /DNA_END=433 /DNA_ORIENTATION=-